jgi:hypothetical protein
MTIGHDASLMAICTNTVILSSFRLAGALLANMKAETGWSGYYAPGKTTTTRMGMKEMR